MNQPSVSVVITTHFRDDLLAECLDSLAAQTLPLQEVVVIDDGGNGTARALVEGYGAPFSYIWQSNAGMQNARNHGVRESTGTWIAFLDDDDLWLPERHALISQLIATEQVDLISGDFVKFGQGWVAPTGVFDEIEQQSPGFWDGIPRDPRSPFSVVGSFPTIRLVPVYPFWPSTLVVRRDLFDRLSGWDENVRNVKSEDIQFAFRAIKHGRLGLIWHPTIRYRSHTGNDSSSDLLVAIGRCKVWEYLLLQKDLSDTERAALNDHIIKHRHNILHAAFTKREFAIFIETIGKIATNDMKFIEKIKLAIAQLLNKCKYSK